MSSLRRVYLYVSPLTSLFSRPVLAKSAILNWLLKLPNRGGTANKKVGTNIGSQINTSDQENRG